MWVGLGEGRGGTQLKHLGCRLWTRIGLILDCLGKLRFGDVDSMCRCRWCDAMHVNNTHMLRLSAPCFCQTRRKSTFHGSDGIERVSFFREWGLYTCFPRHARFGISCIWDSWNRSGAWGLVVLLVCMDSVRVLTERSSKNNILDTEHRNNASEDSLLMLETRRKTLFKALLSIACGHGVPSCWERSQVATLARRWFAAGQPFTWTDELWRSAVEKLRAHRGW